MRNNKGISMIALIITIIVIIILAAIIFIASGDTVSSANYATFSQEFGDYGLNFQNDALADVRLKYGTQGKVISNPQAIYLASNPANTITDGLLIPAGVEFVTRLKELDNPALYEDGGIDVTTKYWGAPTDGTANNTNDIACYELADNAIEGYKKPQFYGDNLGEEKHYVTQNGFVFTVPGYPREVNGENRMYISAGVYYLAGDNYKDLINVGDLETVEAHTADGSTGGGSSETEDVVKIPTEESAVKEAVGDKGYVGYYADLGGDGSIDGIIYADLAVGVSDGAWGTNSYKSYSYNKETGLKEYTIDGEAGGPFGTKGVIREVAGTTGADRFYVMALEDFEQGTTFTWYKNAYGKLPSTPITSGEFGTGEENTKSLVEYNCPNAEKVDTDIWNVTLPTGWFIPSRAEWAAFGGNLGITTSNRPGLSDWYWSSSQSSKYNAYYAIFFTGYLDTNGVGINYCVRLSTTF